MTLEIHSSGKEPKVYEDDEIITLPELRTFLGPIDRSSFWVAARRTDVESLPYAYSRRPRAKRPLRYQVRDVPKLISGLAMGRSTASSFCPRETEKDFNFTSPTGATVIYRYPKK